MSSVNGRLKYIEPSLLNSIQFNSYFSRSLLNIKNLEFIWMSNKKLKSFTDSSKQMRSNAKLPLTFNCRVVSIGKEHGHKLVLVVIKVSKLQK